MLTTVSFHNFKSQNFKLSVSNPKSKHVAYLSVLSQISNCQGLGRKNKHEDLKTDRMWLCTKPLGASAFGRRVARHVAAHRAMCIGTFRGPLFRGPPMTSWYVLTQPYSSNAYTNKAESGYRSRASRRSLRHSTSSTIQKTPPWACRFRIGGMLSICIFFTNI